MLCKSASPNQNLSVLKSSLMIIFTQAEKSVRFVAGELSADLKLENLKLKRSEV